MSFDLVVMGASWGGLGALERILGDLPGDFATPIAVAQHRSAGSGSDGLAKLLSRHSPVPVVDVEDKQPIERGRVYLAPPDYHLHVDEGSFSLSMDDAVLFSRPSIDVLFESAAEGYRERLIAVVLTGANEDGAAGVGVVKRLGGHVIVQNPVEAERSEMPRAAMRAATADSVLSLEAIAPALVELCGRGEEARR